MKRVIITGPQFFSKLKKAWVSCTWEELLKYEGWGYRVRTEKTVKR